MTQTIAETLASLEAQHTFPGPFMFKAIGENSPVFIAAVTQAVVLVVGIHSTPHVTTRASSGGRHTAVTLMTQVQAAQQVLDVYAALGQVPGIKMVM